GNRLSVPELQKRVDDVWRILARANVSIEVCRGAEHYYGEPLLDAVLGGDELVTFRWDDDVCLLIELPMDQPAFGVRRVAAALQRRDVVPVMAHPERCSLLAREYERIHGWREAGWRFQLNLLSVVGRHGRTAQRLAHRILDDGFYDCVGSDIHRPAQLEWVREAHDAFRSITTGVAQP
ncbi:MAG: hypothetical protein OER88_07195, partial [Planctomycetota bacterium]|nr:hypothetical protein [Planctomycetota bacterium]